MMGSGTRLWVRSVPMSVAVWTASAELSELLRRE